MPDPKLPEPYDGQPVIKTTVKITRAGDGLSEALATDQQTLHLGEKVTVVLETEVVGVNIKPLDKETPGGPLVAQYVLAATDRATLADGDEVEDLLDAQARRNEQARGIERLPMDDDVPRDAAGFPLSDKEVAALTDMNAKVDAEMEDWMEDDDDVPADGSLHEVEGDGSGETAETWDEAVRRHLGDEDEADLTDDDFAESSA